MGCPKRRLVCRSSGSGRPHLVAIEIVELGLRGIAAPDVHRALRRKPIRSRTIGTTRAVHRSHAVEHVLHAVGECVVGRVHIGKQRITPKSGTSRA